MPSPEDLYHKALAEARKLYERDERRLRGAIVDLLRDVADRISGTITRLAGEGGELTLQDMGIIEREVGVALGQFRTSYEGQLLSQISQAATVAATGSQRALNVYVQGVAFPGLPGFDDIPRRVVDIMTERTIKGLNLSDRIWRLDYASRQWLQQDVLNGVNQGWSAAKIAKRAERWLLPDRVLPKGDVPSAIYSNQPRNVSYNAYRLARTEINQAYGEARDQADAELADAGIALGSRWVLSPQHAQRMLAATDGRTARDICDDWAERMPGTVILDGQPPAGKRAEQRMLARLQRYGIDPRGVYLPGRTPLDHPNGLCTTETVLTPREVLMERMAA